jgi:hypothetical protein
VKPQKEKVEKTKPVRGKYGAAARKTAPSRRSETPVDADDDEAEAEEEEAEDDDNDEDDEIGEEESPTAPHCPLRPKRQPRAPWDRIGPRVKKTGMQGSGLAKVGRGDETSSESDGGDDSPTIIVDNNYWRGRRRSAARRTGGAGRKRKVEEVKDEI